VQLPLIRAVVRLAGGDAEKSSCATGDALANQTLDEFGGQRLAHLFLAKRSGGMWR